MATNTKQPQKEISADSMTDKFIYVLSRKLEKREGIFNEKNQQRKSPEYQRVRNLLLRSSIIWPGGDDLFSGKERSKGKYLIRFYDGCSTLFVDDQPKDKQTIDNLVNTTRQIVFNDGYVEIYGYDIMLKTYMDICSWNVESPYRVPTAEGIFQSSDADKLALTEGEMADKVEEALGLAKTASEKHMRIHARFLDVPEHDEKSGGKLSVSAMRAKYRTEAMARPVNFINTFNDKTIQIKSWIDNALDSGQIDCKIITNKAAWKDKGVVICDMSGIVSKEGKLQRLIEFSQSVEGEDFLIQLKALYS